VSETASKLCSFHTANRYGPRSAILSNGKPVDNPVFQPVVYDKFVQVFDMQQLDTRMKKKWCWIYKGSWVGMGVVELWRTTREL